MKMNTEEDVEEDEFGYSTEPDYEEMLWRKVNSPPDARGRLLEERGVEVLDSGITC
jgi:hypothetical protein